MSLIRYNGKNILYYNFETLLMPGVNELEVGLLETILKHPLFKCRFDNKTLEIIEDDPVEVEPAKEGKRGVEEMLKLIPDIHDKKLLEKIIKSDGRNRVIAAAQAQVHKLSVKAEDEEVEKAKAGNGSFRSSNS